MLDQLEIPVRPDAAAPRPVGRSPAGSCIPNAPSGVTPVPQKVTVSRPQQLLELAGKVARAGWGGIGLLSADGELVEHLTFGISDQTTTELSRSPLFTAFIRLIQKHPVPTCLADLAGSGCDAFLGAAAGTNQTPHAGKSKPPLVPKPEFGNEGKFGNKGKLEFGNEGKFGNKEKEGNRSPQLPPLGSFLGVPLIGPGPYQGALYLTRSPDQPPFGREEEETVVSICGWLEQARLFDETHLLTRLRLLNQVAQAAAGNLDLERILAVALRELDRHLPLHVGAVWLVDETEEKGNGGEVARWWSGGAVTQGGPFTTSPPHHPTTPRPVDLTTAALVLTALSPSCDPANSLGLAPELRLRVEETPFAVCLSDGQALYADLRRPVERNSSLAENLAGSGASAYFAVPLRAGDRTVGVLQSVCTRPSGFTNEQIQLLYLVADLLGPAICNCRLFGRLSAAYEELRVTQTQLIQTEKMRALGELAAGMAHDFNNSLCAVLGFLELALLDKGLPAACRDYLQSSHTCALDAARTVHRVQDFARWRRNEMAVEPVDPNELVRQTMELTRHKWDRLALARETSITVETRTEATAQISGNSAELREVLTNLVFNAVDAMPQGGSLVVRTWSTATDVFLSVRDTGVGISDSVRRRLFEPFFTTKGEGGNGMGLSVSFGIIQRHNGEITVESVLQHGSTFTVRLPVAVEPVAPEETTPVEQTPVARGRSLRVLVVEDEESIRRFLAVGLTQLGHRPRMTANAQEGLAAFAEESFDVVLTDLGLPGVSGEEVARTVAERSPGTPVVLLTGWADQIKAETKPVAGVKQILGKPITLSTLATTLMAVCQA